MSIRFISIAIALLVLASTTFINTNHALANNEASALIKPLSYDQWQSQLKSYSSKVIVVDFWAMWCSTCIEQFPDIVKLHSQYKNEDVQFVSMNLDDRDDIESLQAAESFLHSVQATFDHFRMDENLMLAFEKTNLIGIPAVLIYDQAGNEQYRLTGDNPNKQFSKQDIEEAIVALLK